jgi:TonB-like protein
MRLLKPGIVTVVLFFGLGSVPAIAQIPDSFFAFVNPQYVMTAEVASQHGFIVNIINLSDFVIVVQPSEFIYKGTSGRFYIGQVYEQEHTTTRGESIRYSASVLLKGHSFTGLKVLGAFHELDHIEELSMRIGAKRYYMQSLDKTQFDQLAAKVGELDLKNSNSKGALQDANIAELGTIRSTDGTSEWDRDWQNLITSEGLNPPKIIERPDITPTDESRKNRVAGKIKLSGIITKNGEIQDLHVIKGLGHGLDDRALEAVKSSWVFLPATKNGEVVETSAAFEVEISSPASAKKP